ncbi:MAG: hypothetical protein JWM62_1637, partial [Frankiales bacterium]|nr:hypothetical protein [Frankiales bacterium]
MSPVASAAAHAGTCSSEDPGSSGAVSTGAACGAGTPAAVAVGEAPASGGSEAAPGTEVAR